jgi:hypothetical protein
MAASGMAHTDQKLFRPVVLAPTYNNARTLGAVLRDLAATDLPIIVVNDGCTDESAEILRRWQAGDRYVVSHAMNQGKAAALRSGFVHACDLGFTHAVTIDTDGQHDAGDVMPLVEVARRNREALVVGRRATTVSGYPLASRVGRAISNFLIRCECGVTVADSQCGLRVYPLNRIVAIETRAGRFGFETEIITRAAWAGLAIVEASVRCVYDVPAGRTSHFRPWRDSFSAVVMHARLLAEKLTMIRRGGAALSPSTRGAASREIPPRAEPCTPPAATARTA